jgi:ATP synthase protein I
MTQPQASGPAHVPPFAAMLRAAVIPTVATAPIIVLVFWITRQTRGGLAALLGVSIAVVFFASGLYVMKRVTNANPISVLAGALAVYLGQVIFLGLVILTLQAADWLDGTAFGLSVLAVALIWQVCQVVAFVRMRKPVYDEPAEKPSNELVDDTAEQPPGEPADEAADEAADESAREPRS